MNKLLFLSLILFVFNSCNSTKENAMKRIIFLHHSTGKAVMLGSTNRNVYRLTGKGDIHKLFAKYNKKHKTEYTFNSISYPGEIYGGRNYPYDYYNIWVKNAGNKPYKEQATLEMLTKDYDVIIFKHCFPVGFILEDTGKADIDSEDKRLENYYLQYNAIKEKMKSFPDKIFILWTPPALVQEKTTNDQAQRTQALHQWLVNEWNEADDNIFLWDIYKYETEGQLYLKPEYAKGPGDSHPNVDFASRLTPLFGSFIIDCINKQANQ
jgi:hypothetical protein